MIKRIKNYLRCSLLNTIRSEIEKNRYRKRWFKRFPDTLCRPGNLFDCEVIEHIGQGSYGIFNVICTGHERKISIGNFVSIANNVCFIINDEHNINTLSTYPFKALYLNKKETEAISKGDIIINDDVWIGRGATIMSNVSIGQGAIIAAGAVVTKDVPPYAIVGGIPAKVIKYRFSEDIINKMKSIDYSEITPEFVEKNIDLFYKEISINSDFNWLPQKKSEG